MSWEESRRFKKPCPCGKGTWVEVNESDDWLRERSYGEINCPVCRVTHRIEEIHGIDSGMATVSYRVVPRGGKPDSVRRM